jgi:hypothetical protein
VRTTTEYGVVGVQDFDFRLDRVPASADLSDLVERHWLVSWSVPTGRSESVTLLPHRLSATVLDLREDNHRRRQPRRRRGPQRRALQCA